MRSGQQSGKGVERTHAYSSKRALTVFSLPCARRARADACDRVPEGEAMQGSVVVRREDGRQVGRIVRRGAHRAEDVSSRPLPPPNPSRPVVWSLSEEVALFIEGQEHVAVLSAIEGQSKRPLGSVSFQRSARFGSTFAKQAIRRNVETAFQLGGGRAHPPQSSSCEP